MKRALQALAAAAALALASTGALADQVAMPYSGTLRMQSGYGCGEDNMDACDETSPFSGEILFALPSSADGTYSAAGITMTLTGLELTTATTSFTSLADGQFVVRIVNGWVELASATGGYMDGPFLSVAFGDGNNSVVFDEPFSHSRLTINAVVPVPEPATSSLLLAGLGALAWRRRQARKLSGED